MTRCLTHHRRLLVQPPNHLGGVVGDLPERLLREDLWFRPRHLDGLGAIRPIGGETRVPVLLEQRHPAVPAARQQPEAVDEDDGCLPTRVRLLDLPFPAR
jgi:hypothetical protein